MKGIIPQGKPCTKNSLREEGFQRLSAAELRGI
jgi:hypothetical protein